MAPNPKASARSSPAGGSGITPVFSLVKVALVATRPVRLLYANRRRLGDLPARRWTSSPPPTPTGSPSPSTTTTSRATFDEDRRPGVRRRRPWRRRPLRLRTTPFMDLVERGADRRRRRRPLPHRALHPERRPVARARGERGRRRRSPRRHADREQRAPASPSPSSSTAALRPPPTTPARRCSRPPARWGCRRRRRARRALRHLHGAAGRGGGRDVREQRPDRRDEVAEGGVLTCQSVPTTPTVHVVYGFE